MISSHCYLATRDIIVTFTTLQELYTWALRAVFLYFAAQCLLGMPPQFETQNTTCFVYFVLLRAMLSEFFESEHRRLGRFLHHIQPIIEKTFVYGGSAASVDLIQQSTDTFWFGKIAGIVSLLSGAAAALLAKNASGCVYCVLSVMIMFEFVSCIVQSFLFDAPVVLKDANLIEDDENVPLTTSAYVYYVIHRHGIYYSTKHTIGDKSKIE